MGRQVYPIRTVAMLLHFFPTKMHNLGLGFSLFPFFPPFSFFPASSLVEATRNSSLEWPIRFLRFKIAHDSKVITECQITSKFHEIGGSLWLEWSLLGSKLIQTCGICKYLRRQIRVED